MLLERLVGKPLSAVTVQKGVQGDGRPPAGARGALAKSPFFQRPPQAAREGCLNSYYISDFDDRRCIILVEKSNTMEDLL